MISYRRGRNFKDILVKSDITENRRSTMHDLKGFFPCGHCRACKSSHLVKEFLIPGRAKKWKIEQFLTCSSNFVIYVLECPCQLRYVGSTTLMAKKRVMEHLRAITNVDTHYPIARHFQKYHRSDNAGLKYFVIDQILPTARGGNRELALRVKESKWILELETKFPGGHNLDEELATHLHSFWFHKDAYTFNRSN